MLNRPFTPDEPLASATPGDERPGRLDPARRLFRPIVLLDPDRIVDPPSWLAHIPFAFWLMDVVRPRVFVELGTHTGNSYAAFAQAAVYLGLEARGYAVDTWRGDPHAGFYDESVFNTWRHYHDQRYGSFSALIRSTFDEAVAHFPEGTIDLLNIDGYHTAEAVRHDFATWLPKMSSRGVIVMHDINVREGTFGAWRVWAELRDAHPSFEFLHGHGLGVLAVGPDVAPDIAWLTGLARHDTTAIVPARRFFARLGGTLLARYRAEAGDRLGSELATRTAEVSALQAQLTAVTARDHERSEELQAQLAAVSSHADALGAQLQTALAHETQRQQDVAQLTAHIGDLTARLTTADARLATAEAVERDDVEALAALRAQLDAADGRAEQQVTQLAGLIANLDAAHQRHAVFAHNVARQRRGDVVRQTLLRRAAEAAATEVRSLRARARAVQQAAPPVAATGKLGRGWDALRALGITPGAVVRRPRALGLLARLSMRPGTARDANLIAQSGLFHADYYRRQSPDVAASPLAPLAHFVLVGGAEGRAPHPLFDAAWYLARYGDVAASGANPLAHYLRAGAREGRDPHPLFSTPYYRSQFAASVTPPDNALLHYLRHGLFEERSPHPLFDVQYYVELYGWKIGGLDPFVHFLEAGAVDGCNPHPLFDVAYYRDHAGTRLDGRHPLRHYVESGAADRLPTHPLFDPAFYLASYQDVAAAGVDPLTHFVTTGGREGRRPIPQFDSAWYLDTYPDIARTGINPLIHFVRHGWLEGRNPSPQFDTLAYLSRYADVEEAGTNPLTHYVRFGRHEGRSALAEPALDLAVDAAGDLPVSIRAANLDGTVRVQGAIVCLSHVMPIPPRAGNEYRIDRMLRWLTQRGYVVIPLVAPNDGSQPGPEEVRRLADVYGNAIVCLPNGQVQYVLRDLPDALQSLGGEPTPRWASLLGEDRLGSEREQELLRLDRAFCTDTVIATLLRLQSALGPHVLLAEYIWMSRVLPLVGGQALKVIDTIDVFSSRAEKVGQYGVDDLIIEKDEERVRLAHADLIIAIQHNEREALEALAPGIPVVTAGVDFDLTPDPGTPIGQRVLVVASGNPMNRRGLRDFLRFAWPTVRELVPDAELLVVGAVGEGLTSPPAGVNVLGKVADLGPLYQQCRVVINPAVAGTGVKIKTLEALSHLRPVVAWPNGVDGLSPEVAALCRTVEDWYGFAEAVATILKSDRPLWFTADERAVLARANQPAHVYAEVGAAIDAFFADRAQRPPSRA